MASVKGIDPLGPSALVRRSTRVAGGDSTNDENPRPNPFRTLAMTIFSKGGRTSPKHARS
jgi:hypothetical protein